VSHSGQDLDGLNPPMDGGASLKEFMMNPTVDELLSLLLSCVQFLTHPTAQLQQTLRSWDREDQWRPRIRRLQRRGYIKPAPASAHFPYLVTRAGRQRALGAVNPDTWWNRSWDGKWFAFSFDLPIKKPACRGRLLRWLHAKRFGCLQNSVWIRPDAPTPSFPYIHDLPSGVDGLVILEARCYPGFTDDQIVKAAWNFDVINDHYRFYLDLCETRLAEFLSRDPDPHNAIALLRQERSAWNQATRFDPLLPRCLWPVDYLGPTAWDARRQLLGI
jgi:DNA-binding transcriptional regulator PaaX